jgi:AmmeMemoRadiSam system protein B/AmmeMemoRadiSam system protein A
MVPVFTVRIKLQVDGIIENFSRRIKMVRNATVLTIILLGGAIMTFCAKNNVQDAEKVREPGVAGAFYPGDPAELRNMLDELLQHANPPKIDGRIIGIISPHAGYVYSGHVAAQGYELLKNAAVERVIVISPSHILAFSGSAIYNGDAYQTPLGKIRVDTEFCRQLEKKDPTLFLSADGHETRRQGRMEHALEVQLPFLQDVIGEFKLVPIVMGEQNYQTCRALGTALAAMINDDKTIIIASSDLSHFHSYKEAVQLDHKVISAVREWDHLNLSRNLNRHVWEACGGGPIVAMMIAAEELGANGVKVLKYANSGDVAIGQKSSVVGYMSAVFYKSAKSTATDEYDFHLNKAEQDHLMHIAKESVEYAVREGQVYECTGGNFEKLNQDRGAFVTLNKGGHLRGCIGYTSAVQPLYETVRSVAISAALKDPRFPAVKESELDQLSYEISVLSPFHHVKSMDQIQVGKHGLLIKRGQYEGLLLPQVGSDNGWDTRTFLRQTCRKAGLPENAWEDEDTDIFIFSAFVFGED